MIGDRIKELRKALGINQTDFATRIGSVQNTITGYETGRREPSNQVITLICREFRVSEEWLRNGTGDMFIPSPSSVVDQLAEQYGLTAAERTLIERFITLDAPARKVILDYITDVADKVQRTVPDEAAELHAEVDRQLGIEKDTAAK